MGLRAFLDTVVKRKIPSPCQDSNPLSSSPKPSAIPLSYPGSLGYYTSSSFLGSTVQLRPWPPPQNPAEFLGGFSTIFFFTG
jgi:hypothetical protein